MEFLDALRRTLDTPNAPRPSFVPNVAAHRRHVLDSLAQIESSGKDERLLRRDRDRWSHDRVEQFAVALGASLLAGIAHGEPSEEVSRLIDVAISRSLGLGVSTGSRVKDWELDELSETASSMVVRADALDVARYAVAIRALRGWAGGYEMTPIGRLVLDLPDPDALRWMLTAEVVQSDGDDDPWRISRKNAARLRDRPRATRVEDDEASWPVPWQVIWRLSKMGLLELEETFEHGACVTTYRVSERARPVFAELADAKDTPFVLFAKALLEDETRAVLGRIRPLMEVRGDGSAAATVRHARMVAHEIRNALVPIRVSLDKLYEHIDPREAPPPVAKHQATIDANVDRIFTFIKDIVNVASHGAEPAEPFDVVPAINDAVAAIEPDSNQTITFDHPGAPPALSGHRERFTLAVINILRNAVQARLQGPLVVAIRARASDDARDVEITIDDNGPGVDQEHREMVFRRGFSRRPGGSGEGLALVRDVVEIEMGGRATCEPSPLGGARFVLVLPVNGRKRP